MLNAEEHDRVVAFTSHLPQLAATALAETVGARLESDEHLKASGQGLADTTRLALSAYEVWKDILETNTEAVGAALDAYVEMLNGVRARLESSELGEDFLRGAELRGKVGR